MKKGFTLLELIIVVIIIGILASIALPIIGNVAEKSRTAEALAVLGAARQAQLRYAVQHGSYAGPGDCDSVLDVSFTNMRYFMSFACNNAADDTTWIVRVERNGTSFPPSPIGWSGYKLCISADGTIYCYNNGLENDDCSKLGYSDSQSQCQF